MMKYPRQFISIAHDLKNSTRLRISSDIIQKAKDKFNSSFKITIIQIKNKFVLEISKNDEDKIYNPIVYVNDNTIIERRTTSKWFDTSEATFRTTHASNLSIYGVTHMVHHHDESDRMIFVMKG